MVRANKKDAFKDLEKALDLDPNLLNAHLHLVDMSLLELDFPTALKHLNLSSELVGGEGLYQLYQKFMAFYMMLGQFDLAEHYVDKILSFEPDNLVFLGGENIPKSYTGEEPREYCNRRKNNCVR